MDRVQSLTMEITKAYKLAHKPIPPLDEIRAEASLMSHDLATIPDDQIQRCYNHARINGRSSVPTSRDIVGAWSDHVKPELDQQAKRVEYKPFQGHSCRWCGVVALRVGYKLPDPTDWELEQVKFKPSQDEIHCVIETVSKMPCVFDFWAKSDSPYCGLI